MPKKWTGENSKAAEARARKDEQKRTENERKQREAEDAKWRETDSKVLRKQDKLKEDQERQDEKLRAKAAAKAQLDAEQKLISKELEAKRPVKYTKAFIASTAPKAASTEPSAPSTSAPSAAKTPRASKSGTSSPAVSRAEGAEQVDEDATLPPLEENINRTLAALRDEGHIVENSVDGAIVALSSLQVSGKGSSAAGPSSPMAGAATEADRHPERRARAAHAAFEERRMKELKEEMPTARLSQLKEIIWKEWQKSPENPIYRAALQK
eukprot:TRINITY_DN3794_c0_g1_i1.p1 TRINITY_DN3794_c0_g1~~TRINITY_DN3794_c0_g1_i1.p1  ORF type:complete len:268 (+),score=84.29 TRINITY_DN3794_c0_g1_i1:50-853(+)